MKVQILKSKIHRVKVTDANLDYIGSITIDERLMKAANILEGEKIQVVNNNNGEIKMGESNILNKLPISSSNLYAKNMYNFVNNLFDKEKKIFDILVNMDRVK